jgi:ABC-type Fe3+-hydroxamate transport system substrate-binding protein
VTNRKRRLIVLAAALAVVTAGCGSGGGTDEQTGAATPTESTVSPSDMTDQQQAPSRLVIDVTIKGGEVTPTNAQLSGKVGEPVVVRVNSDAADELHVHSNPEHSFPIEPRSGQQFQFTVDVPGTVDIELHKLNRVIASVQVQQ